MIAQLKFPYLAYYKRWILWYINYASKYLIKSERTKAYQNSAILLWISSSSCPFICLHQLLPLTPIHIPSLELIASCLALNPQTEGNDSSTTPKWLQRPSKSSNFLNPILYSVASPSEDVHKCPEELNTLVSLWLGASDFFSELLKLTVYNPFVRLSLCLLSTCSNPLT